MTDPAPSKPNPDPTSLTTDALHREIAGLRELLETRLTGIGDTMEERLRRQEDLLEERDRRYTERHEASQRAVDAAFHAAERKTADAFAASEKAILKAEVSIEKRADATYVSLNEMGRQLSALMPRSESEARYDSIDEKLSGLGTRVERIEATKQGGNEQRSAMYALVGFVVSLIVIGGFVAALWPK